MNTFSTKMMTVALAVASAVVASAAPVNENQALSAASRFMSGKTLTPVTLQRANRAPGQQATAQAYYVFNAQASEGYVIVAGDDRVPAVLGYSDNGTFDPANVPPAMQALLDGYAAQIAGLPQDAQAPQQVSRTPIRPLLHSIWGQGEPFNYYLPFTLTTTDNNGVTRAWHAKTGCVATAMAQVMYYHKWPARTTQTIPAYTSSTTSNGKTLTFDCPAMPVTALNWDAMKNAYNTTDSTQASGQAVAKLMECCDQALEMQFSASSSSAQTSEIPMALTSYFDYDATARYVKRISYTTTEWESLLYSELEAGRPVVYRGDKNPGGHAFVCDGCDASGLFHINWGWNSQSNGYFLLRDLNPDAQGIGGSDGECGYIYDQGMAIGIKPNDGGVNAINVMFYEMEITSTNGTRTSSGTDFSVTVLGRFLNNTPYDEIFDYGWGLYQGTTLKSVLSQSSRTSTLQPNYYITVERTLSFGSGLSNGTYELRPIFKEQNQSTWKVCEGGMSNYVTAIISGNNCTFEANGTKADPNYVINNVTFGGTLNTGKQVNVTASVTNKGKSLDNIIYMFVNGVKTTSALSDLEENQTGDLTFHFTPTTAGTKTVTFSLNENGTSPLATRTVTINIMPEATLATSNKVLNITNGAVTNYISSNMYSVETTFTNNGTTAYNEEVTLRLYRVSNGTSGSNVQDVTLPLQLAAGQSKVVRFDCDNVVDGEKYFAWVYYYSAGQQVRGKGTSSYTIIFPNEPEYQKGDVNGDGKVDIADVNAVINVMLGKAAASSYKGNPNVNGQGDIDIADVNAVINLMLGK